MSESTVEVTDTSAFEEASLGKQVLLSMVTIGLYNILWFYQTSQQLAEGTSADVDPATMTILLLIPFLGLWKFSGVAQSVTDQDQAVLFLLFVFSGGIGGWFVVQSGINNLAGD